MVIDAIGSSNDETNFQGFVKLLQMIHQLIKTTQLSKMMELGGIIPPGFDLLGFFGGVKKLSEDIMSSVKRTAYKYNKYDKNISTKDLIIDIELG